MNRKKPYPKIKNIILKLKEKKDKYINSRLEPLILENGLEDLEMALVFKSGLMELVTKVNGRTTELMVMGNLFILMEMSMKEIGLMIKLMGLDYMCM